MGFWNNKDDNKKTTGDPLQTEPIEAVEHLEERPDPALEDVLKDEDSSQEFDSGKTTIIRYDDPEDKQDNGTVMCVSEITIGNEIRPVDFDFVEELSKSIEKTGLLNPITVTEHGVLIAGRHRLEAYKKLDLKEIPVNVVPLEEHTMVELAQIDENIIRNNPTALERGELLKRRKQIYEEMYPETRSVNIKGGPGRGKKGVDNTQPAFAEEISEKIGSSTRTIREDLQIANNLTDETKEVIKGTPLENKKTELLHLAREKDPEKQAEMAKAIVKGKKVKASTNTDFQVEEVKIALNNIIKEDLNVVLKYINAKRLKKLVKDFA